MKSIALLLVLCGIASGEEIRQRALLENISVHDGDTVRGDLNFGYGVALRGKSIRLAGFDAPEISRTRKTVKITAEELVRGKVAREALVKLLADRRVWCEPSGDGESVYGRLECHLLVETESGLIDVSREMRRQGHER